MGQVVLGLVDLGEDLGSDLREVGTWRAVGRGVSLLLSMPCGPCSETPGGMEHLPAPALLGPSPSDASPASQMDPALI